MIGGERQHGCGMIARRDPTGAERDRRSGVAFRRLGNNIFFRKFFEQIANSFFLFSVDQNQDAFVRHEALESRQRFFEQSPFRNKAQQLFGTISPAQRPKPLATAAGENERVDRIWH